MKLDIIVPHYKEPWSICHWLFDTIETQMGIDKDDIRVVISEDNPGTQLENEIDREYSYRIVDIPCDRNGGVSRARNVGLEFSDADYVMFCDCDDMFLNNYGLHLVFSAMNEGADAIRSSFVEEQIRDDGWHIIRHDDDSTFVHGKAYNRLFLLTECLKFNPELTIHEDGYFNCLALTIAERKKNIETPFYLWKWNKDSVVRKNPDEFVMKTYDHLMRCRIAICEELENRGYINELIDCVIKTVLDSYYDFNKPSYLDRKNLKDVQKAEKAFRRFFVRFRDVFNEASVMRKAEIALVARQNAFSNGFLMEQMTLKEWLLHILKEVKA